MAHSYPKTPRKTALIKFTGDLTDLRRDVVYWLEPIAKEYHMVIVTGGGTRINEAFKERGLPITFGPLGREVATFAGRQLARDMLELNQVELQDALAAQGIAASVLIPVLDIGSVLCHVNGDVFVQTAYLGFDKIFVLTLDSRKEQKVKDFASLPKVEVVSFPDTEVFMYRPGTPLCSVCGSLMNYCDGLVVHITRDGRCYDITEHGQFEVTRTKP